MPDDRLIEFIGSASTRQLPAGIAAHALRAFVNFAGCALAGFAHDASVSARKALAPGAPSTGFAVGRIAELPTAALLDALAGAVHAFDDTHARTIVHPGPPVAAGLLACAAAAPSPISGSDYMTAYALGLEVACRVSLAVAGPRAVSDPAWSQTGIAAPLGVAAAGALLLGFGTEQTRWALGTAASIAAGSRMAHGSTAMHLLPARAAAAGAESVLLARAGVTGPDHALTGRHGFLSIFAEAADEAAITDGLGSRFEFLDLGFKAYPCGTVIHPLIDACLAARGGGLDADRIDAFVAPSAIALADRPHPANEFEAQVSLQHWAAAAIVRGEDAVRSPGPALLQDPRIASLRQRVTLHPRATLAVDQAEATITTRGGAAITRAIEHCLGSAAHPLDDAAVDRKFLAQVGPIAGENAAALLRTCRSIAQADDVVALLRQIDIAAPPDGAAPS